MTVDAYDLTGKILPPRERFDVVIIGAGKTGTAAAIDAAKAGKAVLLIDENPVSGAAMGNDTPLFFGARMTAATQNSGRMLEQVFASNPALEIAFEAGVDVRLGTCAWGLYRNGPALQTLPEPMLGLADHERAYMVGFDCLVLASGARDLVLGFAGWNQPGVMGAQAFDALLNKYDALSSTRVLILGSGQLALETALAAVARGIEVAGLVEVLDTVQGPVELAEKLCNAGISIHIGHVLSATKSGIDGVEGATLIPIKGGADVSVTCDTICLAIGTIPATELLAASGIKPDDSIRLIGDCAAAAPDMATVQAWARALAAYAPADMVVCQCEEVTRIDLLGVQPPNYLERSAPMAARSLRTLAADGPAHPDQIKRLTRAGMGTCQGRRCREQIACLLAEATNLPIERVPTASYRAPIRPIPLKILADWEEGEAMIAGWDVWFGIPTQWTPYAIVGTPEEAEHVSIVGGYSHV
jgi:thioredoxin reductase